MLLIITNSDDLTADFMITKLIESGHPYFRVNSDEIQRIKTTFAISENELQREILLDDRKIDLNEIRSVWYRRMISPTVDEKIEISDQSFVATEVKHLFEGMLFDSSVLWVNPIDAVAVAERKVFQLRCAKECGLILPPTIVSNDSSLLKEFIRRHRECICKPIFQGFHRKNGKDYSIYTRRISEEEISDEENSKSCPTLVQKLIPKGTDIRVTFIGERVFSAEVTSESGVPIDWRRPDSGVKFRPFHLDRRIEEKCRMLLKRLHLCYGAFDFVRTNKGDLYFLEVNPTGEWAWLELDLRMPMSEAFKHLFYGQA